MPGMVNHAAFSGKTRSRLFGILGVMLAALLAGPRPVQAADTTEPFLPGLSDFEMYATAGERDAWAHSFLLGYGVKERLSVGLTWDRELVVEENADALGGFLLWTFWNRKVDADLIGQYVYNFPDEAGYYLPGAEISLPNDYLVPYSRLGAAFAHPDYGQPGYSALAGLSWPVMDRVEVLAESEWEWESPGAPEWELALGLNLMLAENLELITEVRRCDPDAEPVTWEGTLGIIATLEWLGEKTQIPGR